MTRTFTAIAATMPSGVTAPGTIGVTISRLMLHFQAIASAVRAAAGRRHALRQLGALDDRMLKDIGYTRSDVVYHALHHRPDPDLRDRSAPKH